MVSKGQRRRGCRARSPLLSAGAAAVIAVAVSVVAVPGAGVAAPAQQVKPLAQQVKAPARPARLAASPAPAAGAGKTCESPSEPGKIIEKTPWHLQWLAPERVWPFSTGAGVKVAVVDSGSDANHPQLQGKVQVGWDALANADGGTLDCVSHGTAVASIIAATREEGVGFRGLAPGVEIIPVRVTEREAQQSKQGATVDMAAFGTAIRKAVDKGAKVINLSVVVYYSSPEMVSAIEYAKSRDVVLVAAAGNQHRTDGLPDPLPFPASLDGVIGVGAIDEFGARVNSSQVGPYVDLVAPGGAIVAATRAAGHESWTGTSFAAPMVSAAAALVRAAEPKLTAKEVTQRLIATADPARGGLNSEAYGHGVVNLYRAVTERLTSGQPQELPPLPAVSHDAAAEAKAATWRRTADVGVWIALGVGSVVLVVVGFALVLPKGRRRGWRPGRWRRPADATVEVDDPEAVFFQVPVTAVSDAPR